MNVKKTGLYILIILLLILLLLFFICNRKSAYDGDSSDISDSEIGQIGYMKDVTSGNEDNEFVSSQAGAGYKAADDNKGKVYSAREKDSSSSRETVSSPVYKDDTKDLKIAEEKKEASVTPPVPSGETKSSRDEAVAKDKTDTKEIQEKSGEVKVAEKTEKDEGIKSAAVKADEKTLVAKNTVVDEAVSKDKVSGGSSVEKAKDKVSEDVAGSASKEKTPLTEEKIAASDEAKTSKQEDKTISDSVRGKSSRLDRVRLYSGRVLTGTVTERADDYIIIENEGKEKISTKDIQGNEIIK